MPASIGNSRLITHSLNQWSSPGLRSRSLEDVGDSIALYDQRRFETTTEFRFSAEFSIFRNEFVELLLRLQGVRRDGPSPTSHPARCLCPAQRNLLCKRILILQTHLFANPQYFPEAELRIMWTYGKLLISTLCRRLEDETLSLNRRTAVLEELPTALDKCQGGVITALQDAVQSLTHSPPSLGQSVALAVAELTNALITEFIVTQHGPYRPGNEVHIANAYRCRLNRTLPDSLDVAARDSGFTGVSPEKVDECERYLKEKLTPGLIADRMTDSYVNAFHSALSDTTSGDRSPFERICETEAALRMQFGSVNLASLAAEDGTFDPKRDLIQADLRRHLDEWDPVSKEERISPEELHNSFQFDPHCNEADKPS